MGELTLRLHAVSVHRVGHFRQHHANLFAPNCEHVRSHRFEVGDDRSVLTQDGVICRCTVR